MTRTSDDAMSRSATYLQAYRRHRLLCWTPIVLGAVMATLILFIAATTYRSTASLWIDTSSAVPSSIGASGNAALSEPPATSEQGILGELLTTKAFADSVVSNSVLGRRLGARATAGSEASTLLRGVKSSVAGEQILNLTYSGSSRAVAQSVLASVVNQLQTYNNSLANQHAQAAVAFDTQQVKLDETAVQTATNNVRTYVNQHPNVSKTNPVYISLTSTESDAVTALGQATTTLNDASASTTGSGWVFRVLDSASPGQSRAPDKKKIVAVIVGGAFGGLLVSLLALLALVPGGDGRDADEPDPRSTAAEPTPTSPEPADDLALLLASLGTGTGGDGGGSSMPPADPFTDEQPVDDSFPWERLTAPRDRERSLASSARASAKTGTRTSSGASARTSARAPQANSARSTAATKTQPAAKSDATKPAPAKAKRTKTR